MKKYISIVSLLLILVPSIALASWWNPLSWFNNWNFKKEKIEEVKENLDIKNDTPKNEVEVLKKEIENLKKQVKNPSNSYNNTNNKPTQNLNIENNTTKDTTNSDNVSILKITNIQKKIKDGNVTVTWETNYPSESTITLIQSVEKIYPSSNGLSKNHSITLYGLVPKNEYNFKIIATTEDKKQKDTSYGLFYVIEQFTASLGEYDDEKECQTIILMDINGRLKSKQISINAYKVSDSSTRQSYGRIDKTTDSNGEVRYCEKPNANELNIEYLGYDTVYLRR